MENKDNDGEWNSNEIAFEGLTCEQVARLSTAFLSYMRLMASSRQAGLTDMCRYVGELLERHAKDHENFAEMTKNFEAKDVKQDSDMIGMLAILMAALALNGGYDPRGLASISYSLMEGLNELIEKSGPPSDDETILIGARIVKDMIPSDDFSNVQIKMNLIPNEAILREINKKKKENPDAGS